jgi:hypothetical protein
MCEELNWAWVRHCSPLDSGDRGPNQRRAVGKP